jgi:hypothetical protein
MDREDAPPPLSPADQATPPDLVSKSRWKDPFLIGGLVGFILLVLLYLSF